jgi:hypothetical protein
MNGRRAKRYAKGPTPSGEHTENRYAALAELPAVLDELRRDVARPGTEVLDLQLVVQFCEPPNYFRWSRGWRKAWQRARFVPAQLEWPLSLPEDRVAALLLPLPAGRVGGALTGFPTPIANPSLVHAALPADVSPHDLGLNVVMRWIQSRGPAQAGRLAPPVLEQIGPDGVPIARESHTWGVEWDLPAADGIDTFA